MAFSDTKSVTLSAYPSKSIRGPILFTIFINNVDDKTVSFSKFIDDTELEEVADMLEYCTAVQMDLDGPEKWASRNSTRKNASSCSG